ncbi:helix-turn-helix domain-containing protein [Rhodococcus sp. 66b]|uniref:helix-turn-helix domain-containing protein n=1 Tax=Rhodococcus sp. 66b TaxID=1945511 RepID=UPI0009D3EC9E|nr:helix-turn-helix transcriptional regulator [Rhodococcus sp. 66b]MDJ0106093.1 helix-turn-helix transcriptional regulator [Rhodococcus erythropolis]OQM83384.1 hypothetical protein B0E55_01119 [Rhodococcus sp. 66b]
MNLIRNRREALGMTQQEAARRAGLSLATWCRVEGGGDEVVARASTIEAFESVLKLPKGGLEELRAGREVSDSTTYGHDDDEWVHLIAKSFNGFPMTSRQAYKISTTVVWLRDDQVSGWDDYLSGRHTVSKVLLLNQLPDWVLFMVNSHWLEKFKALFVEIGDQIDRGEVPGRRCVAERVALRIALHVAAKEDEELADEIGDDLIDDDHDRLVPPNLEIGENWQQSEDALLGFADDIECMWDEGFTRVMLGADGPKFSAEKGFDIGRFHPLRWWEPDVEIREGRKHQNA